MNQILFAYLPNGRRSCVPERRWRVREGGAVSGGGGHQPRAQGGRGAHVAHAALGALLTNQLVGQGLEP